MPRSCPENVVVSICHFFTSWLRLLFYILAASCGDLDSSSDVPPIATHGEYLIYQLYVTIDNKYYVTGIGNLEFVQ